jgi:uncharacterized protein
MWIKREITEEIQSSTKTRPCVVLTGARQTGKSSLLEKAFPEFNYISLDLPNLAKEATENGGYFLEKNKAPLIIDEIQYAPELFRFLKVVIDKNRNSFGRYLLTGSQKFSLMKGVSESLSGRISIYECHSLSIREIQRHTGADLTADQILKWMIQGGYPEIHAHDLRPERFYADYLATYLERDIRQLVNVKDLTLFDKFLRLLALRSGQILSMNSLASDVGASSHTIKNWISVLETSNVIYLLRPFYNNFGKRLVKSPKLYFLDTGLLCFLAGIHSAQALGQSSLLGSYFETLALGQLVRNFCNKGLPVNLYYFRDNHGHEMDFIIPEGNQVSLLECKWQLQNGIPPKNISVFKSIFGEENIKTTKIITSAGAVAQIKEDCFVTNIVDL